MTQDDIIVADLALDALKFMERVLNGQAPEVQGHSLKAITRGGHMEVRVRMSMTHDPRISLALIGDKGEIELAGAGGQPKQKPGAML